MQSSAGHKDRIQVLTRKAIEILEIGSDACFTNKANGLHHLQLLASLSPEQLEVQNSLCFLLLFLLAFFFVLLFSSSFFPFFSLFWQPEPIFCFLPAATSQAHWTALQDGPCISRNVDAFYLLRSWTCVLG